MGETKVKRVPVDFDYEGLNWNFIKLLGKIGNYAKGKYGSIEQYADGRLEGEKSPMNHIIEHYRQYIAREPHDKFGGLEYHLAAIAYNAMMEYYYLLHGGPTVTDKLHRPEDPVDDWPGIKDEVVPVQVERGNTVIGPTGKVYEPSDTTDKDDPPLTKGLNTLKQFFGRHDAGKSEGSVSEAGN